MDERRESGAQCESFERSLAKMTLAKLVAQIPEKTTLRELRLDSVKHREAAEKGR